MDRTQRIERLKEINDRECTFKPKLNQFNRTLNTSQVVEKSLYERLGGSKAIQAVVDKMYEKIFVDEELTDFFRKTDKEK